MPVSSIQNNRKGLPTFLIYLFGIAGMALVVYFGGEILRNIGNLRGKAVLIVETTVEGADVYIDGDFLGKTPFQSDTISPGENTIEIKDDTRQYQTSIKFLANSKKYMHQVGIARDLGISDYFSSGSESWFEEDKSENILRIISEPSDATIFLDGTEVGRTPFLANNLTEGDYDLRAELEGFEPQEARIHVKKGYTLNITLKLFPAPVPAKVSAFEDAPSLYDLSSDNPIVTADTRTWAETVVYWNKTRGINLKGVGVSKELVFDYFIDYKGNAFNSEGVLIETTEEIEKLDTLEKGAYLGQKSDGVGLSKEAGETLEMLSGLGVGGNTATIKETGVGWLRVRDAPGLSGKEITRVDVGNTYSVLEKGIGWVKIKVSDEVEGWVSTDYVTLSK